jgi:hypothetical protein
MRPGTLALGEAEVVAVGTHRLPLPNVGLPTLSRLIQAHTPPKRRI